MATDSLSFSFSIHPTEVSCPTCSEPRGAVCRSARGLPLSGKPHKARIASARESVREVILCGVALADAVYNQQKKLFFADDIFDICHNIYEKLQVARQLAKIKPFGRILLIKANGDKSLAAKILDQEVHDFFCSEY